MNEPALTAVKELTTNLLYLGVGVFALVGGFLSQVEKIKAPGWLLWSLFVFGDSLLFGLGAMMRVTNMVTYRKFNAEDSTLLWCSTLQVLTVMGGAIIFFIYLFLSIRQKP